ncbi:MAG: AI-2E family transporter [Candidatus Nealsonbacteria bacterium]|nr:AI-2E family transporter [Candidatus Nealsonbacteria bacterium]
MNGERLLDISWRSILKVALAALIIYILYSIRDILIFLIFALIISVLFNPAIDFLERRKIHRVLATGLVYVVIFGFFGGSIYLISVSFIPEVRQFASMFSEYFEKITPSLKWLGIEAFENFESFISATEGWLLGASSNIFTALSAVFGGVFAAFTIFSLAFFFSLEGQWAERVIRLLFPKKIEDHAVSVWERSQQKISGWFGIRVLCCFFVGLATFLALKLFKIDYAFSLGLFAGITNIIPILGPILAGGIIAIMVILEDWLKAVFILIVFFLIQQVEGNILTPFLSKKFIGLPPVLVLIALLIGGQLWGLLGAILAIPLAGILFEFVRDFFKKRKDRIVSEEAVS